MDRKAYKQMDKLRAKRRKLKEKKSYILNKIRKYPVNIQRAVVNDLWRQIMDIERQIDTIILTESNTSIIKDAHDLVSRTLPLGASYELENHKKADSFDFYRADKNSLLLAFGALRKDISMYVDDLELPDLFIGPFEYINKANNNILRYFVLLDEASYFMQNEKTIRFLPDIIMFEDRISVERDMNAETSILFETYKNRKDMIQAEINNRIDSALKMPDIAPDIMISYHNYRKLYDEFKADKILDEQKEKDLKLIKKLKKRFSLEVTR